MPDQVAVVGFDDIPVARFLNPPLTSVRVGIAAYGLWPSKETLAIARQRATDGREATVIDLPGTYSLVSRSPDELVAHGRSEAEIEGCG